MLVHTSEEIHEFSQPIGELYKYEAYGLTIQSEFQLPELIPGEDQAEVIIRRGRIDHLPPDVLTDYSYYDANEKGIFLAWEGVGAFHIRNGNEMIVEALPGVEDRIIRLFILGTALAMLLHQRKNMVVLHASVVAMSGKAVAFVGEKGAGKSTLAGTLNMRGHHLIADDILAINTCASKVEALNGFPHLKLWPDSVETLGFSPESLPKIRPELDKRSFRLKSGFSPKPLPLKGIYVLEDGTDMAIEKLQPQKALLALMPHWYGARFGMDFLQNLGILNHFQQCTKLVDSTPIYQLIRPRSLKGLSKVARRIESHASENNHWE